MNKKWLYIFVMVVWNHATCSYTEIVIVYVCMYVENEQKFGIFFTEIIKMKQKVVSFIMNMTIPRLVVF